MNNNATYCNTSRSDNEIDLHRMEKYPGVRKITIKPQTDQFVFPETNKASSSWLSTDSLTRVLLSQPGDCTIGVVEREEQWQV